MVVRRAILIGMLPLGLLGLGLWWRGHSSVGQAGALPAVAIEKQPAIFATRTFDPASPPPDMPPLSSGDQAECDSNFLCRASVRSQTQRTDATHAVVTVDRINVTLQLSITIWLPVNAPENTIEHEDGHSQISQSYYRTADKVAEQIALAHIGDRIDIAGADLNAEADKALQQVAADINAEFSGEFNPDITQRYYDTLTDHGRNRIIVKDAVAAALRDNGMAPAEGAENPAN